MLEDSDGRLFRTFNLSHQIKAIQFFATQVSFADKTVLEVGGALPAPLVLTRLAARRWVAVNFFGWEPGRARPEDCYPLRSATTELLLDASYRMFDGKAEDIPDSFHKQFDIICSINAFEHIQNIWKTLEKLYKALKPGGLLLATFSPIWPGRTGHHVWIDKNRNFNTFDQLPDYIHLRYSKQKCRSLIIDIYGAEIADRFIQKAFFDPVVNRLFVEDYVEAMQTGPFEYWRLAPWGVEASAAVLEILRCVAGERFYAQGLNLLAQKAE